MKKAASASAVYVKNFFDRAVSEGVDQDQLLSLLDSDLNSLDSVARRYPCERVLDMIGFAETASGNSSIGFETGVAFSPATFGEVAIAAICASTLQEASNINSTYEALQQEFGRTRLTVEDDLAIHSWSYDLVAPDRMRPITEAVFAGLVNVGRWLIWSFDEEVVRVRFRHSKKTNPDPCADYFKCDVLYEQDQDELIYKSSLVKSPLPQANEASRKLITQRLDYTLRRFNTSADLTWEVSECIRQSMANGPVSISKIASMIGLSTKTLSRRLAREETNFRDILQSVRKSEYEVLSSQSELPLAQIALALGYSDQSAFSRARKSWLAASK